MPVFTAINYKSYLLFLRFLNSYLILLTQAYYSSACEYQTNSNTQSCGDDFSEYDCSEEQAGTVIDTEVVNGGFRCSILVHREHVKPVHEHFAQQHASNSCRMHQVLHPWTQVVVFAECKTEFG